MITNGNAAYLSPPDRPSIAPLVCLQQLTETDVPVI